MVVVVVVKETGASSFFSSCFSMLEIAGGD